MLSQSLKRVSLAKSSASMPTYARHFFSTSQRSRLLVETDEVADLVASNSSSLRFVNASWYMGSFKTDARVQHEENRLTQATQYFDISKIVQPGSSLPNTMPSAEVFSEHMRALRIPKDSQIVCYDHVGMFSVARCAWMFRFFGVKDVRIMNGGLQKWIAEGRDVYSGDYEPGMGLPEGGDYSYAAVDESAVIMDIAKVHEAVGKIAKGSKDWQIADARLPMRFKGLVAEPRNMRSGHITGSKNVFYQDLIDEKTGGMKSDIEIQQLFEGKGFDMSKNTIHSCGSGVTACILELGWNLAGGSKSAVYDGSWSEYGRVDEPDFKN